MLCYAIHVCLEASLRNGPLSFGTDLSFDGLDDKTCDANMKPAVVDDESCGEPTRMFWLAIEKQFDTDDRRCDERQR